MPDLRSTTQPKNHHNPPHTVQPTHHPNQPHKAQLNDIPPPPTYKPHLGATTHDHNKHHPHPQQQIPLQHPP